jgi:predicted transposase
MFVCDITSAMETIRTIVCKLTPTAEQRVELDATLTAFAEACDFIAEVARRIHSSNKVKVQHEAYNEVRQRFGLSANLAIRAIARVCAALKVKSKAHSTFAPTSIDYDQRIFSFREWDWTFSLTLLHSRVRLETVLGDYQKGRLKGQTPTSAVLVKRRDSTFFCMSSSGVLLLLPRPLQARWGLILVDAAWPSIRTPRSMKPLRSTGCVPTTPKFDVRSKPKAQRKPNGF